MNEMKTEMILKESEDAATKTDLVVWKSRTGRHFICEESARSDGATHVQCESCKNFAKKPYPKCEKCRASKRKEWFNSLEVKEYNGEPVYSDAYDEYFFDESEIADFVEDNNTTIGELNLLFCSPVNYREVTSEIWEDQLPEDSDVPPELQKAIDELNKVASSVNPASWYPGKVRVGKLKLK